MARYEQKIGRVGLAYRSDYGDMHAVTVSIDESWASGAQPVEHVLSVEEMIDLQYLIGRALIAAKTDTG